jgi:hypothetical protein
MGKIVLFVDQNEESGLFRVRIDVIEDLASAIGVFRALDYKNTSGKKEIEVHIAPRVDPRRFLTGITSLASDDVYVTVLDSYPFLTRTIPEGQEANAQRLRLVMRTGARANPYYHVRLSLSDGSAREFMYHRYFTEVREMRTIVMMLAVQQRKVRGAVRLLPSDLVRRLSGFLTDKKVNLDGTAIVKVNPITNHKV